jgi:hypothetical protein
MEIDRRRVLAGALGLTGAALLGTRGSIAWAFDRRPREAAGAPVGMGVPAGEHPLAPPGSPGLVDEATWQGWVDDYLHGLTSPDVISQLARSHREPDYVWDAAAVKVGDFASMFDTIDNWKDTRDFRFMDIHWMLHLADGATPTRTLDPTVIDAFESRLAGARWRYDDPLPDGVTDNQWYWSENHLIIGLVGEYLAGQRMPDRVFGITGLTGAEHMARSKPDILAWIEERARFGFFEFHSTVYMRFNIRPLMMLAEMADDPDLIRAAGMGVDLCLLDVAAHNHKGSYVAAEGRVYAIADAASWAMSRFLWRNSDGPVGTGVDSTTVSLCAAQRYRPPQVLLDIARSSGETLVRERHGVYYDAATPITPDPVAPFGYDFDDPENLEFWWSQGAVGLWPMSHVNLEQATKFRLFDNDALSDIQLLVALNGNDPDKLAAYLQKNQAILNFGHLQEVNTYHWRNDVVALATAQDYRFGSMRDQVKPWKAVIDERVVVYTTHPRSAPDPNMFGRDGKPGYWTGEASQPRSAQFERTAVHIYQPAWDKTTDAVLWQVFQYQDFTHAFFPQERFDEVVQDGNWTFGRKGDGYIGLWSWRAPTWTTHDTGVYDTRGLVEPFDLVAKGGPDNVWIVEVGDASQGPFADWLAARLASPIDVTRDADGFTVGWTSPASGALAFGSSGPFVVDGAEQALDEFPRHDAPWGRVERLQLQHEVAIGDATLELDFEAMTRTHGPVPPPPPTTTTTTTTPTTSTSTTTSTTTTSTTSTSTTTTSTTPTSTSTTTGPASAPSTATPAVPATPTSASPRFVG